MQASYVSCAAAVLGTTCITTQWLHMNAGAEGGAAAPSAAEQQVAPAQLTPEQERQQKLEGVLAGSVPIQLYLEFLYSHNHADVQLLKNAKVGLQSMQALLITFVSRTGLAMKGKLRQ